MSAAGAVTLVVGDEELLVSRAIAAAVAAARAVDPDADVRTLESPSFDEGALIDLSSPSMFGELRVLVLRLTEELTDSLREALLAAASDLPDDARLVVHPGSKNRKLVTALTKAGADVVACHGAGKPWERGSFALDFVVQELRAAGRQMTRDAVAHLVEAVGTDLRELAGACAQLIADCPGQIDEAAVRRFHQGRAETTGFEVAEAALSGQAGEALALLAAAFEVGVDPVPVVAAFGYKTREIAKVHGARGTADAIAQAWGMKPGMVRRLQGVCRQWTGHGLAQAIEAIADADFAVKGGGVHARYAVERLVLDVVAAHSVGKEPARARAGAR